MLDTATIISLLFPLFSFSTGVSAPAELPSAAFLPPSEERPVATLPMNADRPVEVAQKTVQVLATAYSSDVAQTDSTPTITASGTTTRMGIIAANDLPIGARVRLPDFFGDQVFIVEDRMNARYGAGRIDVWLPSTNEAKQFGVKYLAMEILP